jgi:hypothetical protein
LLRVSPVSSCSSASAGGSVKICAVPYCSDWFASFDINQSHKKHKTFEFAALTLSDATHNDVLVKLKLSE